MVPDWAVGVAAIVAVIAVAQIAVGRSGVGRRERARLRDRLTLGDPEVPRLTEELEGMQRRLAELEERVDFHERLLATQREKDRLTK
jgi:hypothetical protein